MIRSYNRITGEKQDLNALSRLKAMPSYIPTELQSIEYDPNALRDVTNMANDVLQSMQNVTNAITNSAESAARDKANEAKSAAAAALENGMNMGDTSDSNLLAMIFKIIPIGVNVVKKSGTILQGLKEVAMGIVDLIKNIAVVTAIFTIDTIEFVGQLLYYLFKLMICSVSNLTNLHKCILFYLFDVFIFLLVVIVISALFMIDMIFMVKNVIGISCVELFMMIPELIGHVDEIIYEYTDIHFFRYPSPIIKLCYTCDAMGDTSGFKHASSEMFKVVFKMIPKDIGHPISDISKGIGHMFSFFNI